MPKKTKRGKKKRMRGGSWPGSEPDQTEFLAIPEQRETLKFDPTNKTTTERIKEFLKGLNWVNVFFVVVLVLAVIGLIVVIFFPETNRGVHLPDTTNHAAKNPNPTVKVQETHKTKMKSGISNTTDINNDSSSDNSVSINFGDNDNDTDNDNGVTIISNSSNDTDIDESTQIHTSSNHNSSTNNSIQ